MLERKTILTVPHHKKAQSGRKDKRFQQSRFPGSPKIPIYARPSRGSNHLTLSLFFKEQLTKNIMAAQKINVGVIGFGKRSVHNV